MPPRLGTGGAMSSRIASKDAREHGNTLFREDVWREAPTAATSLHV